MNFTAQKLVIFLVSGQLVELQNCAEKVAKLTAIQALQIVVVNAVNNACYVA